MIDKIYYYAKNDVDSWLIGVSGTRLCVLEYDAAQGYIWRVIGVLHSEAVVPSFLTYNTKLLIADGGPRIKVWEGSADVWSVAYTAAFATSTTATLAGDRTEVFSGGRPVKADCGVDGVFIGSVAGASYDSGTDETTVTIQGTAITANLTALYHGFFYDLETSPPYATAVVEIGNRVVCNSGGVGELDTVYFSGVEDETDWDTAADDATAVAVRAGYMDGMTVNAFGVLGTDLMVFKGSLTGRRVYRISTSGTAADWYTQMLSDNATALTGSAVAQVGNDLWFADDTGIKAISQTQTYGDLALALAGMLVEAGFSGATVRELTYLPSLGVLAVLIDGVTDIFLYHPHNKAWTTWNIGGIAIRSICDGGGRIYLAGDNGFLYRLGVDDLDELTYGVSTPVAARLEGKQYVLPREGIIRRSRLYYDEMTPTSGEIAVISPGVSTSYTETKMAEITPIDARILNTATEELAVADASLARAQRGFVDSRSRYRNGIFSFVVKTTKGRVKLKSFAFDVANVEG